MKTKFQPNVKLPVGAKVIAPIRRKIGGYNELVYDAVLERHGIQWYRIKGGWGQVETSYAGTPNNHPNEAWVADIKGISLSLSDYEWNDLKFFAPKWGTFEDGLRGKLDHGFEDAHRKFSLAVAAMTEATNAKAKIDAARDSYPKKRA